MLEAPNLANDAERIAALHQLNILDSSPEERFDRITRIASQFFNIPIALITLVDANRRWVKSCYGVEAKEVGRDISFCGHAIAKNEPLVIEDTTKDPRFSDNPLVAGGPRIRFYAGQPLRVDGDFLIGAFCLIDHMSLIRRD